MMKLKSLILKERLDKNRIKSLIDFFKDAEFNTVGGARKYLLDKMIFFNIKSPPHMQEDAETLKFYADSIPLYKKGNKFKVGYKLAVQMLGDSPEEKSSDFPVDWRATDLPLSDKESYWTPKSVRKFVQCPNNIKIYPAIIDLNILNPIVEKEKDQNWSEFETSNSNSKFPPIVVIRTKRGKIVICDGNHRVYWAKQHNYDTISAWVADYMISTTPANNKTFAV